MPLTNEQFQAIDPVYRDFMLALKPIIDSRSQPFQIRGMPASKIYDASARKYGFDPHQFYEIAENLRTQGLIERDEFEFYYPTSRGEALIQELYRHLVGGESGSGSVPPLELGS